MTFDKFVNASFDDETIHVEEALLTDFVEKRRKKKQKTVEKLNRIQKITKHNALES